MFASRGPSARTLICLAALVAPTLLIAGCVRRTLTITTEPDGALCWLNGREVGTTPVTVEFLYYGKYDVLLTHDGCEPLQTVGDAKAPLADTIPLDVITEVLPKETHIDIRWHYTLEPRKTDRAELITRADELRQKLLSEAPVPPGTPEGPAASPPTAATAPAETPASSPDLTPESAPATQPG